MCPDNWGCGTWALFILITLSFILSCATTCNSEYYNIEEPIISIHGELGIEGHFSIFSGHINSEWYYLYMVDLGHGSYRMDKCLSDLTTIQESNIIQPCIKTQYCETTFKLFWIIPMELFGGSTQPTGHTIVVPTGTIIESYVPQGRQRETK